MSFYETQKSRLHLERVEEARLSGRWAPLRKDSLLILLKRGDLTLDQAVTKYGFSADEIASLTERRKRFGTPGLKTTALQAVGHG